MSNLQFGRKWRVLVIDKENTAIDTSQLRCTFRVEKVALSIANYAEISIYNLNSDTENEIVNEGSRVILEAGYESYFDASGTGQQYQADQYGTIFEGKVIQTIRTREENVDYVLTLVCLDGDSFLNHNIVAFSVNKKQNPRDIINSIASNALVPSEIGRVSGELSGQTLPRGKVIFGEPKQYLRDIAQANNGSFYMEDEKIYVEKSTDIEQGETLVLTPQTGLVGTPEQVPDGVTFKCLLNPKIRLKTAVKIDNSYIRQMKMQIGEVPIMLDQDNRYQCYKVTHYGNTRGQDWYTEVVGIGRYGKIPLLMAGGGQSPW
jgi:hypothetical protein